MERTGNLGTESISALGIMVARNEKMETTLRNVSLTYFIIWG